MAEQGLTFNIFSLDPEEPSKAFQFRTHNNVVSKEIPCVAQ